MLKVCVHGVVPGCKVEGANKLFNANLLYASWQLTKYLGIG